MIVPSAAALFRDAAVRPAGHHRPLWLQGRRVWWIESGRVDVFSLPVVGDVPAGGRMHLFRADAGRLLCGGGAAVAGRPIRLLAVGGADTRLRELDFDHLLRLAAGTEPAPELATLLDEWIDALSAWMADARPPGPCRELSAPGEVELEASVRVRPRDGVLWVEHERGSSTLLAQSDLPVGGGFFPLARSAWLETRAPSRVRLAATGALLARGEVWAGVERLQAALLDHAQRRLERLAREEHERLRLRALASRRAFGTACAHLARTLEPPRTPGPAPMAAAAAAAAEEVTDPRDALLLACRLVCEWLRIPLVQPARLREPPAGEDPLEAFARASGFRVRPVVLRPGWWQQDGGPLLAEMEGDGRPVALLPRQDRGYTAHDPLRGRQQRVTSELAEEIRPQAHAFYSHFPEGPLSLGGVIRFGMRTCRRDLLVLGSVSTAAGLLGMLTPVATGLVFNDIIPGAARGQLAQLTGLLLVIALSTAMFRLTGSIALLRVEGKMSGAVQAAVWDRLLTLATPFFRRYAAGDLAMRAMAIDAIRQLLAGPPVTALITGVFSLLQFILLFHYSPRLAWWALVLIGVATLLTALAGFLQLSHQRRNSRLETRISGMVLQFLTSISKLRVAGAEVHAFARWAEAFSEQRREQFRARTIGNLLGAFNGAYPLVSSLIIYALALPLLQQQALQTGDFLAFTSSFNACLSGLLSATTAVIACLAVIPLYELARPILEAEPERQSGGAPPGRLAGDVEAQHLTFRYHEDGPVVIRDVSFHVRPGEFLAFVGPSGSGKSTLLRLLLAFEEPESGAVYYDGKELAGLDVREVRSQIGVVLQNGRLMHGDIFSNIVGSAALTIDDAWEAARMAGLESDVRAMPMGMHTVVSEGGATLSGGQRQRLLIARAIVRRPRLLLFDEATSALDNRTQAIVTESLKLLNATRIIIAHRLSTVMRADRICVMQAGRIVEQGTYDELLRRSGLFAELARRQLA